MIAIGVGGASLDAQAQVCQQRGRHVLRCLLAGSSQVSICGSMGDAPADARCHPGPVMPNLNPAVVDQEELTVIMCHEVVEFAMHF